MKSSCVCAWTVFSLLVPSVALAQASTDEGAVVVDVAAETPVSEPLIRAQIERELRVTTVGREGAAAPRRTLQIFVSPEQRLTVRWISSAGARVERSVPAPSDPAEFVRMVGVLAVNLVQDPVAELGPAPPPVQVVVTSAAPAQQRSPVAAPTPAAITAPVEEWRARRARQIVSVGLDVYSNVGQDFHSPTSFVSVGSAFVNVHVRPWLRVGLSQITGGELPAPNGGYLSANPYAEFVWAPIQWLEVFGQVSLGFQGQFTGSAGGLTFTSAALAMNATAGGGARFRIGPVFSLGLGLRGAGNLVGDFRYSHVGSARSAPAAVGVGVELGWAIGG